MIRHDTDKMYIKYPGEGAEDSGIYFEVPTILVSWLEDGTQVFMGDNKYSIMRFSAIEASGETYQGSPLVTTIPESTYKAHPEIVEEIERLYKLVKG